ncbi:hypothetical protein Tco_0167118 [Tanacetum coccineum]
MWARALIMLFSKPDPHAHDKTSPSAVLLMVKGKLQNNVIPKNQVVVVVGESDTRNTTQPPQVVAQRWFIRKWYGLVVLIKTLAASKQPELENHVGVRGYGYPAFIPLNIKNGAYALLKSAFEREQIMCGYCLRKSFGIRNMTWISTAAKMF